MIATIDSTTLLASIIAGEAGICGPMAWLAVAYVYSRNQTFYARGNPTPQMFAYAETWWMYSDPTFGARYLVNDKDLKQPAVRAFTVDRGPPTAVFICAGGRRLYAFGDKATEQPTYYYPSDTPTTILTRLVESGIIK